MMCTSKTPIIGNRDLALFKTVFQDYKGNTINARVSTEKGRPSSLYEIY